MNLVHGLRGTIDALAAQMAGLADRRNRLDRNLPAFALDQIPKGGVNIAKRAAAASATEIDLTIRFLRSPTPRHQVKETASISRWRPSTFMFSGRLDGRRPAFVPKLETCPRPQTGLAEPPCSFRFSTWTTLFTFAQDGEAWSAASSHRPAHPVPELVCPLQEGPQPRLRW